MTSSNRQPSLLTLGTAQLASTYGIANRSGRPTAEQAFALLEAARAEGIDSIDTARAYGDAEAVIGAWRRRSGADPYIIAKPRSAANLGDDDARIAIEQSVGETLAALKMDRVDVLLTHGAGDFLRPHIADTLRGMHDRGKVGSIGASAYDPAQVEQLLEIRDLAAVQVPIHALDWRFVDAGLVARCAERNVLVFARSVFCQGLFFLPIDAIPKFVAPAIPALGRLAQLAEAGGTGMLELALGAVRSISGITSIVVGAERAEQIRAIAAAVRAKQLDPEVIASLHRMAREMPQGLLDPRRWPTPQR